MTLVRSAGVCSSDGQASSRARKAPRIATTWSSADAELTE